MRRKIILAFSILLVIAMVAIVLYAETHKKRYSIDNVAIDAKILDSGSMQIVEDRTVTFHNGPFTKLTMDIPKKGFKEITGVEILEYGNIYHKAVEAMEDKPEG